MLLTSKTPWHTLTQHWGTSVSPWHTLPRYCGTKFCSSLAHITRALLNERNFLDTHCHGQWYLLLYRLYIHYYSNKVLTSVVPRHTLTQHYSTYVSPWHTLPRYCVPTSVSHWHTSPGYFGNLLLYLLDTHRHGTVYLLQYLIDTHRQGTLVTYFCISLTHIATVLWYLLLYLLDTHCQGTVYLLQYLLDTYRHGTVVLTSVSPWHTLPGYCVPTSVSPWHISPRYCGTYFSISLTHIATVLCTYFCISLTHIATVLWYLLLYLLDTHRHGTVVQRGLFCHSPSHVYSSEVNT